MSAAVATVLVPVADPDRGLRFYVDGLGFRLVARTATTADVTSPHTEHVLRLTVVPPVATIDLRPLRRTALVRDVLLAQGEVHGDWIGLPQSGTAVCTDPFGNTLRIRGTT